LEVALLWLDDLDDLVFAVALEWESLRRAVLQVGLIAAVAVAACELSLTATEWTLTFAAVAAASVATWAFGAALRIVYYRDSRLVSAGA
jgi:hypothetical protein